MDETRVTKKELESIAGQIEAISKSGADVIEIKTSSGPIQVTRKSGGGFRIQGSGGEVTADLYDLPDMRPAGYPEHLPFVAGESVTSSCMDASHTLTWWGSADVSALLAELDRQSRSRGYILEDEQTVAEMQMIQRQYANGTTTRLIIAGGPMVTLMEHPAE